jgi:hypothetical protein
VKKRNRIELPQAHEKIWKDTVSYPTNQDAVTAISKMVHSVEQVQAAQGSQSPGASSALERKLEWFLSLHPTPEFAGLLLATLEKVGSQILSLRQSVLARTRGQIQKRAPS